MSPTTHARRDHEKNKAGGKKCKFFYPGIDTQVLYVLSTLKGTNQQVALLRNLGFSMVD